MKNFTKEELKKLGPVIRYVEDHPEIIITKIEKDWAKIEVGIYNYCCEISKVNTFIAGYKVGLNYRTEIE